MLNFPKPDEPQISADGDVVCRPWDKGDFYRRLATYTSLNWFNKPKELWPTACARYGWINVSYDTLRCENCLAKLVISFGSQQATSSAMDRCKKALRDQHSESCLWRRFQSPGPQSQTLFWIDFQDDRHTLCTTALWRERPKTTYPNCVVLIERSAMEVARKLSFATGIANSSPKTNPRRHGFVGWR